MHPLIAALRRCTRSNLYLLVLVAFTLSSAGIVSAQETDWIGGNTGTGKWEDAGNWNAGVPVSGLQTRVGNGTASPTTPSTAVIDAATGTAQTGNLFVSDNAVNQGTLIMNGGTLLPSGSFDVGGNGNTGGNGTFLFSDGTVILSGAGQVLNVGLSNATASVPTTLGNVYMSGGRLTLSGTGDLLNLGRLGTASFLQSGGTIDIQNSGGLFVADNGIGTMTVDGGTLLMGTGTVNISRRAGAATFLVKSGFVQFPTGNTNMMNNGGGTANLIVQGGTLNTGPIPMMTAAGISTITVSGGKMVTTGQITMNSTAGGTTGASTILISGGALAASTIQLSSGASNPINSNHIIMSQADPNVPTELSVIKIGQSNANQDLQFNGGTFTIGTIGFAMSGSTFNGGTLSPGANPGTIGGGSGFGTLTIQANNAANSLIQNANYHIHLDLGSNPTSEAAPNGDPNTPNRDYIKYNATGNGTDNVTLNGIIDVDIQDPTYQSIYTVLTTVAGTISGSVLTTRDGNNMTAQVVSHTPGWEFAVLLSGDSKTLQLEAIPEPSMIGLFGLSAVGLLRRRTRRRIAA